MAKKRLDVLLFEKGLCPSRERAKTAIMEGIVYIAGQKAGKAGDMVDENAELEVRGNENAFVSRGGIPLMLATVSWRGVCGRIRVSSAWSAPISAM